MVLGDNVEESNVTLCCAGCCFHCGTTSGCDTIGCSGKVGLCCLNCEVCCKPGTDCLPCVFCGPKCEFDGCSIINAQLQFFCLAITAALPCNEEVPALVTVAGVTLYPKMGCCMTVGEAMERA